MARLQKFPTTVIEGCSVRLSYVEDIRSKYVCVIRVIGVISEGGSGSGWWWVECGEEEVRREEATYKSDAPKRSAVDWTRFEGWERIVIGRQELGRGAATTAVFCSVLLSYVRANGDKQRRWRDGCVDVEGMEGWRDYWQSTIDV